MLLLTDLDNTVIFSHRHEVIGKKIWVETLNGYPQSFVLSKVYDYFREQDWLDVVPITTRTKQQYYRIQSGLEVLGWKDALICNGSILLREGKEDRTWTEESIRISETSQPDYIKAYKLAIDLAGEDAIISADPFIFYIKTDQTEIVFNTLSAHVDHSKLTVLRDSRKVYCFPLKLNKGCAAERYRLQTGYEEYIAIGDSEFDIPMLRNASFSICPEIISHYETKGKMRVCCGLFSDEICDELEKIRNEGF